MNEEERRDEKQRQADERRVILENTHKILTEESYQKIRSRSHSPELHSNKSTSQPWQSNPQFDACLQMAVCAENVLAKQHVIEVVDIHMGMAMITLSLCRKCYTAYMCRDDITVSQVQNMRDNQHDKKKHI